MTSSIDLSAFNRRFHDKINYTGKTNIVSSPLGVWLMLAQAASPAATNMTAVNRDLMEKTLGVYLQQAYQVLTQLLRDQPEALRLAMGAWSDNTVFDDPGYKAWSNNLPDEVHLGTPIPEKKVLDAWVKENSFGIIDEFPADEKKLRELAFVLANVLATKFNWRSPFEGVDNPDTMWKTRELLQADSNDHGVRLVLDARGELFGVVTNRDETGVAVHAVIAANPALPATQVIAFAESYARNPSATPLADIADQSAIHVMRDIESTRDHYTALLPAWEANTTHDLGGMDLPLKAAASGVTPLEMDVEGVQVAAAAYNKRGFEAAAVTAMLARAAALPRFGTHKEVNITFAHPFAVVAAQGFNRRNPNSPWLNLPVFTAWVVEAAEVSDRDFSVDK